MASVREMIERIYRDQIRAINRKQAVFIVAILAAAAAAIFMVTERADKERECAEYARQQMIEWMEGKTIDSLDLTFDELREMQHRHYEECLK